MKHGGSQLLTKVGTLDNPLRIAVFFSGSGTGMNALLSHQGNAQCIHKTVLCVTDKEDAGGIQYAEQHDVPVLIETLDTSLPREERRREHEQRIAKQLDEADIDLIVLSGYMRLLSPDFVERFFPELSTSTPLCYQHSPAKMRTPMFSHLAFV